MFAVLVGDFWQGKGIGSSLLENCLSIAEKQGFQLVHSIVLRETKNMLALGKRMGFEIKKSAEAGDTELVSSVNSKEPRVSELSSPP